jgi:hypothetical protein
MDEAYQKYYYNTVSGKGYPVKISTCEKELASSFTCASSLASEQTFNIKLPSIKNSVYDMYFIIRRREDVDAATITSPATSTSVNRNPMKLIVPSSWQLLDSSKEITKRFYGVGGNSDANSNQNQNDMYKHNLEAYVTFLYNFIYFVGITERLDSTCQLSTSVLTLCNSLKLQLLMMMVRCLF